VALYKVMRIYYLLAVLLVVACTTQQPVQPTDTLPVVPPQQEEQVAPPAAQPTEPVVESTNYPTIFDGLPTDVQDVLHNGEGRVTTGYTYTYTAFDNAKPTAERAQGAKVYQKGDVLKIVLAEKKPIDKTVYFDTIYLNRADNTVRAFCMTRENCDTIGAERKNIFYDDYVFMTPSDWIEEMRNAQKMEEKTLQNRKAVRLDGTVDGSPATVWVDRYSGLPIEATMGTRTYKYEQLALGVKDSDIQP
jgi:hypothetical protein